MGAMGGLTPPSTSLLPGLHSPQEGGAYSWGLRVPLVAMGAKGNPLGGVSRSSPAPDGPPNLGIARILLGSTPGRYSTEFYRFFGLSWENIPSQ